MEFYYTIEQAANHLRVSESTIKTWIKQRKIKVETNGYSFTNKSHFKIKSSEIHRMAEAVSLNKAMFYGTSNGGGNK